jgi:hypothetical protein
VTLCVLPIKKLYDRCKTETSWGKVSLTIGERA